MTYLITFACYGCHLHGSEPGSVDPEHNLPGSRLVAPNPLRYANERDRMDQPVYEMDQPRRELVMQTIGEVCSHRRWQLVAAHVRSNHVHVVVEGDGPPERMMNNFKSYASRGLTSAGFEDATRKRWARHGSTRWLWNRESVDAAIRYVVEGQGDKMAVVTLPHGRGSE
jgi:REP element-mobilizing transposase RayT